jgi:hypothetical protein
MGGGYPANVRFYALTERPAFSGLVLAALSDMRFNENPDGAPVISDWRAAFSPETLVCAISDALGSQARSKLEIVIELREPMGGPDARFFENVLSFLTGRMHLSRNRFPSTSNVCAFVELDPKRLPDAAELCRTPDSTEARRDIFGSYAALGRMRDFLLDMRHEPCAVFITLLDDTGEGWDAPCKPDIIQPGLPL